GNLSSPSSISPGAGRRPPASLRTAAPPGHGPAPGVRCDAVRWLAAGDAQTRNPEHDGVTGPVSLTGWARGQSPPRQPPGPAGRTSDGGGGVVSTVPAHPRVRARRRWLVLTAGGACLLAATVFWLCCPSPVQRLQPYLDKDLRKLSEDEQISFDRLIGHLAPQ